MSRYSESIKSREKTKVVLATPTLSLAGAEKFTVELASRLDRERFDVTVLVTRGSTHPVLKEQLASNGVRIHVVPPTSRITCALRCALFLRSEKPDVIHTNLGALFHLALAFLVAGKPTRRIHTLHSSIQHGDRGLRGLALKVVLKAFRCQTVAISLAALRSLYRDSNGARVRASVIPNGVDTEVFHPESRTGVYRPSKDRVEFISVGSLIPVKDHHTLLLAFSLLTPEVRSRSRLTIVGDGPLMGPLTERARELNVSDAVLFAGRRTDIAGLLRSSDVFVSTSTMEGLPLSLLEAMASGLAPAATAVGGIPEVIEPGSSGLLFPPKDPDAAARVMAFLVENIQVRSALSEGARSRALGFSWRACVDAYSRLYLLDPQDGC